MSINPLRQFAPSHVRGCIAVGPDYIASAAYDTTNKTRDDTAITVWTFDGVHVGTLNEHERWVNCLEFSPDGQYLASGSEDYSVRIWGILGGAPKNWAPRDVTCLWCLREGPYFPKSVHFSSDRKTLVVAYIRDGILLGGSHLKIWNVETGTCERRIGEMHMAQEDFYCAKYSPSNEFIASICKPWRGSVSSRFRIKLWNANTGDFIKGLRLPPTHYDPVITCLAFSPDSQYIVAGSISSVDLWNISTGECALTWDSPQNYNTPGFKYESVAFSKDGTYVLAGNTFSTMDLFSVRSGECLRIYDALVDSEHELSQYYHRNMKQTVFSQDGDSIVTFCTNLLPTLSYVKLFSHVMEKTVFITNKSMNLIFFII